MEQFFIEGGQRLQGNITPSGNKNSALPLLAACLLTNEPFTLLNVPATGDIEAMIELLAELGVDIVDRSTRSITLQARTIRHKVHNRDAFWNIRGAIMLTGPMLARTGYFVLPFPNEDGFSKKRMETHLAALEALGVRSDRKEGIELFTDTLSSADILLPEASVTATENVIMAAVFARGTTVIRNAACEPHVQDLCLCINQMGGRISDIGSNVLTVEGVQSLHGVEFTISADHIEIGSLIGLGAVTAGEICIHGVNRDHLRMIDLVFRRRLGVSMHYEDRVLVVDDEQDLRIQPDVGGMVPIIENSPWPGFPADLLSIALVVATQARGTVLLHDKMFESRMFFTDKITSMGGQIILCDPHRAVVVGPVSLRGRRVVSPDIRAGMALVVAALCATGPSQIDNVEQLDRGYERLEEKLGRLGARIERRRSPN